MSQSPARTLAERAVACEAWRWVTGMLAVWAGAGRGNGSWWRIVEVAEDGFPVRVVNCDRDSYDLTVWGLAGQPGAAREFVPVLGDVATVGCLMELVREAWGAPMVLRSRWEACLRVAWLVAPDGGGSAVGRGETEIEALVAALEAAPGDTSKEKNS